MRSTIISGKIITIAVLTALSTIISTCTKEEKEKVIKKSSLTGFVQKGPYVNGTGIQLFELNSGFTQTGKVFNTVIVNNRGSFEINNIELSSQYVELLANGYYFNEITGDVSASSLSLYALSDITDISTVNVNILTHLEKSRVVYLVKNGKTFSEAKQTAQSEVLGIFGFQLDGIADSEMLDITVNNQGNAILLAISLILQGGRSVGDLTELLANIITDIQSDGILNSEVLLEKMRSSAMALDYQSIRENLQSRYQSLGLSTTIPGFESYVDEFLAHTGKVPTVTEQSATNVTTSGTVLNATINANDLSTVVTFEYGKTTDYGGVVTASQSPVSGHNNTPVSGTVSELDPGTKYNFRVKAENSMGVVYGGNVTFLTGGQKPSVTTQNPTLILTTGASLNGIVNANSLISEVKFEYGLTSAYGTTVNALQSPVSGESDTPVSAVISGLDLATTYNFRVFSENSLGISYGDNITFLTAGQKPSATTQQATGLTTTGATLNGIVNPNHLTTTVTFEYSLTSDYGSIVTASLSPITGSTYTEVSVNISELSPGTVYHYRIRAENMLGVEYSGDSKFTTFIVKDIDGNYYSAVFIGDQVWLKENLRTTTFNDGDPIPNVKEDWAWGILVTPAYAWFNHNKDAYKETYGALYNWYAVANVKLCPDGWHASTELDWKELELSLGMTLEEYEEDGWIDNPRGTDEGGKLKETGLVHWWPPNASATNEIGFTGLPGGYRNPNIYGFYNMHEHAGFWTSTSANDSDAWARSLNHHKPWIARATVDKKIGYSVRCIKN